MTGNEARRVVLKRRRGRRSDLWREARAMDIAADYLDASGYTGIATVLRARERTVSRDATNLTTRIEALKAGCKHDWSYLGHGHNDDLYECRVCLAKKWE